MIDISKVEANLLLEGLAWMQDQAYCNTEKMEYIKTLEAKLQKFLLKGTKEVFQIYSRESMIEGKPHPEYIRVVRQDGDYFVESNLHCTQGTEIKGKGVTGRLDDLQPWDYAMEGLCSSILSQVNAGINFQDEGFIKALEMTIEDLADRYGDD